MKLYILKSLSLELIDTLWNVNNKEIEDLNKAKWN